MKKYRPNGNTVPTLFQAQVPLSSSVSWFGLVWLGFQQTSNEDRQQCHHPHSCELISFLGNAVEPLNKGTWVCATVSESKRKKAEYSNDIHAQHSIMPIVCVDEGAVKASWSIAPQRHNTNVLTAHTSDSTRITGCDKCCSG